MKCPSCGKRLKNHDGVCSEHNQQLIYCQNDDCWINSIIGCIDYLKGLKPAVASLNSQEEKAKP